MAKHDPFVQEQMQSILESGETVQGTGVVWTGPGIIFQALLLGPLLSWIIMKFYYAVLTNQRMVLIKTKMGMFSLKQENQGVTSIRSDQLTSIEAKGAMNQQRLVMKMNDGSNMTLRLNTLAPFVSGQKTFVKQAAETLGRSLPPAPA